MKIFVASFNRASDGAISKLIERLNEEDMLTHTVNQADYILAVGDRIETFDFVLSEWRKGKSIIHLWAGEISQGTEDEVYRHAMTIMSELQLCTNPQAKDTVDKLCNSIGKKSNSHVIGNVMLDNMEINEAQVPSYKYNLILYNPPTLLSRDEIEKEIEEVLVESGSTKRIWIEPNGDKHSDLLYDCVTHNNLSRPIFLGLMKNCNKFITNSSCAYYEAPYLMDKKDIILIGERNKDRNSKKDMDIHNASDNIIRILKEELDE